MEKLSTLLPGVLNKYNIEISAEAAHILQRVKVYILELIGKPAEDNVIPYKYKDGVVFILVSHSSFAQEVTLFKMQLLEKLSNDDLNVKIQDIKIIQTRKV